MEFHERVNEKKLQFLIDYQRKFEGHSDLLKFLEKYKDISLTDKGRLVKYYQTIKGGRQYSTLTLQKLSKDMRGYLSGSFYSDIDIENAGPSIVLNLFKRYGIRDKFLEEYVADRDASLKKYDLEDKISLISIINTARIDPSREMPIKITHAKIYNQLLPQLKKDNPEVFERIAKFQEKRDTSYNKQGKIFSIFYQYVENSVLKVVIEFIEKEGLTIGTLLFDGLLVEKSKRINQKLLNKLQAFVEQKTGLDVIFRTKSTASKWQPKDQEEPDISERTDVSFLGKPNSDFNEYERGDHTAPANVKIESGSLLDRLVRPKFSFLR